MPATVIVNNLTVVHKASGGSSIAAPDVCKTPTPGGPVPIPYVNVAVSRNTAKGSKRVRVDGHSIMHKSSHFSTSSGDEPGTLGGVVSGKTRGKAYPRSYSFDVKVEGQPVFRFTDMMIQNSGSPANAAGIESQTNDLAAPIDVDKAELIEMRWSKNKLCCGDPVTLAVKTRNADDGQEIQVRVERTNRGERKPMDSFPVTVQGDSSEARWISRWRHQYNEKIPAVAVQGTLKGLRDSNNALEFYNPPHVGRQPVSGTRTAPVYEYSDSAAMEYQGDATWDYAYDIDITLGRMYVRRQLHFKRAPGVPSLLPTVWRAWKHQIESVWDHKFYFHRVRCKRGQDCDCALNGCCKYPLRILAVPGMGHGSVQLFLGGPKAEDKGKLDLWWYSDTWWTAIGEAGPYVRAHEFGHLIGFFDEYPEGACHRNGLHSDVDESVMNEGSKVYPRHVEAFRVKFTTHAGVGPVETVQVEEPA